MSSATQSATPWETQCEALRSKHQVRLVTESEEGLGLHRCPIGTYGFTYSPGLEDGPLFRERKYHNFEIHKLGEDSACLVGFAKPEAAAVIDSGVAGEIQVAPEPHDDATILVSVPYWRAAKFKEHSTRENGDLTLILAPAR